MHLSNFPIWFTIHDGKDKFIMLVGKAQQFNIRPIRKEKVMLSPNQVPLSSPEHMSQFNISDIERPLNRNSEQLSFKGLSVSGALNKVLYKPGTKTYQLSNLTSITDDHLGEMVNNLVAHLKKSKHAEKLINFNGDDVIVNIKTIPHHIWDGLIYPFRILPFDILNGTVEMLGKIKPLEKWAKNVLSTTFFKNIRQRSKIDSEVSALKGLLETADSLKGKSKEEISSKLFQKSVKMFDPKTGNYDTKHERALCRIVSGLPPAVLLATDAYNLSRMMDDDPAAAKKEKKARFRQEMSRLVMNAYLMLVTFGALNKYINQSAFGTMLMTGATTLITETYSRLRNGKHITRLTPEEARAENEKNQAPERLIKPSTSFGSAEKTAPQHKETQKPLLSFDTIMKASAAVIAAGFAVKGARKFIPNLDHTLKVLTAPFKDQYNKMTTIADFRINGETFDNIVKVLEDNNYTELARKYKDIAAMTRNADGTISLGLRDRKVKPAVDFFIAPVKFIWNAITLPYRLVDKAISGIMNKKDPLKGVKGLESFAKNIQTLKTDALKKGYTEDKFLDYVKDNATKINDIKALSMSIEKIGHEATKKGYTPEKFQKFVEDNIMKSFNTDTMSSVSNADLANLAKTASTAATIWFLMTDNYNMVMLKSNGNDKEGAETKFKERFVQECSRQFYSMLLIDLFNNTFSKQYHASLLGMSWITFTDTTISEILTRKSVGMTVKEHTRDELLAIEDKQNKATGALKKYYNFMQRLTGKRSIKSYEVKAKNANSAAAADEQIKVHKEPSMQGSSVLNKMIKG